MRLSTGRLLGAFSVSVAHWPLSLCAQDAHRGLFIQQLRPTQNLQSRIKLKLFGHSGSGKTTLVESLKCGLLRSFFRRRRPRLSSTNSTRFPPSPLASKPAGRRRLPGSCLSPGCLLRWAFLSRPRRTGGLASVTWLVLTTFHCLGGFRYGLTRLWAPRLPSWPTLRMQGRGLPEITVTDAKGQTANVQITGWCHVLL